MPQSTRLPAQGNEPNTSNRHGRTQTGDPWMYTPSTRYNYASRASPGGVSQKRTYLSKYTRTPPPRLQSVPTPPHHEDYKSSEDLRGSYYERVPPLRPRVAFERRAADDLDRWGNDVGPTDGSVQYVYNQPFSYALPYGAPGPHVVYPAMMLPQPYSIPGPYVAPPVQHGQTVAPPGGDNKRVRYADDGLGYSSQQAAGGSTYHQTRPQAGPLLSYISATAQPDQPDPAPSTRHYQYLIPGRTKMKNLEHQASQLFRDKADFAEEVVHSLVTEVLEDDLIPDLLIEVLSKRLDKMSRDHPYYGPSFDVAIAFLQDEVPALVREVVMEASTDMVKEYLRSQSSDEAPEEALASCLLREAVSEAAEDVVREVVQELAEDHLQKASAYDVAVDVMNEFISDIGSELVADAEEELLQEAVVDEDIIGPVLEKMAKDVAMDTLEDYNDKAMHQQLKEIMKHTQKGLLDSICLDHLLDTIAMTAVPPGEAEQEAAKQLLEDAMLTIMLEQYMALMSEPARTLHNKPVKRHHARVFTEVALEVLSGELCGSLDEDLADYDDYEQGLWNPSKMLPPEWALYTTG